MLLTTIAGGGILSSGSPSVVR